ncbi:MAG: hypothetical protein V4649_02575 [Bacteroidota bacterium]
MKKCCIILLLFISLVSHSLSATPDTAFTTPFERSKGTQTATYAEVLSYYKRLRDSFSTISMGDVGPTDAGYPLRSISYTKDANFDREAVKKSGKLVILINNAIHPGEPDGVDACMMLLRDAAMGKIDVPANVMLVVIPVYNIGGALNRSSYSRASQNGPESYGFRGNARNLDLNRDFIKCDAAETISLEDFFTRLDPDIFLDNHVSDGADYQHVMTLVATQHDKLGGECGSYMYNTFTPLIYKDMKDRGYDMVPYVNDFDDTPDTGWPEFYESPRYSSGYAALYQTFAYVPETHMLKPFKDRVKATYALMRTFIKVGAAHAKEIKQARTNDRAALLTKKDFPLDWRADTTQADTVTFKGYKASMKPSEVSGLPRLYYDRSKPYTKRVPFYNHYVPTKSVAAPTAYIIPKAWTPVISLLRTNSVRILRFNYDTTVTVTAYHIDNYETTPRPYEKHYLHKNIQVTPKTERIRFSEGDYIVLTNQPAKRYLVETLEPTGPDALLAWNFFDGILSQKEYFSSYVFEDQAAEMLKKDPALKAALEAKRATDPEFAKSADAQLDFIYRRSPYMEPGFMRYPVYRLE